ncbi:MAG: membrane protein insertion efficiency factor YidD [Clostridia bacterium]|nr:membrane protein insertion efficiency factor YidD [Clostridia bacterium]
MKTILIWLIKGYKKFISPLLGHNCRFYPTCSSYAIEALQIHGFFKGSLLAIWRILRCNPFGKPGLDPVPPKGKWNN